MSLNIAGPPRYLGCSTNNITAALKSYRIYKRNSDSCSEAEITSTNSTDCMKTNNGSMMDQSQNSTIANMPEENGKNNTDMKICKISDSKPITTKQKLRSIKVKEINDVITCHLCGGYLINPCTIESCIHSYCRSCIVKHLTQHKYCPKCGENTKEINLSNLKSDDILKTIVYKSIPGLYQKEYERHVQFNAENKITDGTESEEEEYFSPVEPISLSLEYHPVFLEEESFGTDRLPPVKYLQCPAAVTVHHLKRFICSKFGIDPKNEKIQIEIIYDDEILPEYFSLMDVGYSFNWKRDAPMKFFYQILVHNNDSKTDDTNKNCKNQLTDKSNEANSKKSNSGNVQKCVRFKDDVDLQKDINETPKCKSNIVPSTSIENDKNLLTNNNNDNQNNLEQQRLTNDLKQTQVAKKDKKQLSKVELSKNNLKSKESTIANVQNANNDDENLKVSSSSSSPTTQSGDFKSLRSNDVRYDFPSVTATNGNLKTKNHTAKTNNTQNKISSLDCEIPQKPVSKCDIVVSIPQAHIHRASNSSDDSFENLSLAQLKTANKKGAVSPREHNNNNNSNSTDSEQHKYIHDIPKLKIDLPSLKTKFSMPKRVNDSNIETKKAAKNRKLSVEEPQPITNEVDLTTYAKVIGLKPINPIPDVKRDLNTNKISPDASPASASSSSGGSSVFAFSSEISSTTSHKKRKKGKHSKQSKDGKRRKLHAEISSQPADESLKFKLKLTGNHKVHKSERKINDTAIAEQKITAEIVDNKQKSIPTPEVVENIAVKVQLIKQTKQIEGISNQNTINKNGTLSNQKDLPTIKVPIPTQITTINNKIRVTTAPTSTINNNSNPPKYIPTTAIPPPTSTLPVENSNKINSTSPTGLPTEILPKSLPQKLLSMQGPKLPVSPPLPPSLFKTTPMTLQTITPTPPKPLIQPRMPIHSDIRQQMQMQTMQQRKNVNNRATAANFIVPNPPRGIASNAPKSYPINSIASAAHRQAAQFKRSASLDSSPPTLTKQLKLQQDRLMRKAAYASMSIQPTAIAPKTATTNIYQAANQATLNAIRRTSPPISIATVGNNNITPLEQFYYTSTMAPTYTHENVTSRPLLIPPSSVSVTKMTETFAPNLNHPSGLTITPQMHSTQPASTPFQFPQSNKPALEIVRISSNVPPADQQKLLVTNNNTIKQNIPKTTRPPPPPIPLVKIKRSMSQSQPIKPTLTTINAQSHIAQIKNNNLTDKKSDDVKNNNNNNGPGSQILDLSGKSSRSPSREKSNSPCLKTNSPKPMPAKDTPKPIIVGNNLEAALSKLKQQQHQNSSQYTSSLNTKLINQQIMNSNQNNSNSFDDKTKQTNDNSNSLQNLQMLSESAISREKIVINNTQQQQHRTLPKLPKLNEISKMRGNATVRQQNASVRNIPNPSALVFRNNQQMPMLASITKTSLPPKLNAISTTASTNVADQKQNDSNKTNSTTSTTQIGVNSLSTTSADTTTTSKLIASKKNLNLEQLAANLNMRAAAAADNTSKATENLSKLTPPSTTTEQIAVSSNSSTTIPLAVSSTSSSTASPVTVSASLNNV